MKGIPEIEWQKRIIKEADMGQKGGFKNQKLGKNVHRQLKRRGAPDYGHGQKRTDKARKTNH